MRWNRKKAREAQEAEDLKKRNTFQQTIQNVEELLDGVDLDVECTDILNYAIAVICRELAYSVAARPIYGKDIPYDSSFSMPECKGSILCEGNFSLENVTIISETYKPRKLKKAITDVFRHGFRQELRGRLDTTGTFYKEINLFVVGEGKHHLSAAMLKNSGSAYMRICSLEKMFPLWRTDGAYWYGKGTQPLPVYDCRMAILYELARIKSDRMLPYEPQEVKYREIPLPPCGADLRFIYSRYSHHTQLLEMELKLKQAQIDILKGNDICPDISERLTELEKSAEQLRHEFDNWFSDKEKQQKELCGYCLRGK